MRPGLAADHSPLLVPRSWKSRAIPLPTLWATPGLYRDHFTLFKFIIIIIIITLRYKFEGSTLGGSVLPL